MSSSRWDPGSGVSAFLPHDNEDTGLIRLELRNAITTTVLLPPSGTQTAWHVIFEARETDIALTAAQAVQLGSELTVAGALCVFLEMKDGNAA